MNKKTLLNLHNSIYLIRLVEETIINRYSKGQIRCPVHLSIGQEACASGFIYNLKNSDKLFSNHRCHAHYLAKGGNLRKMLCEIYGKKNGCINGVGGSMHLQDQKVGMVSSIPIVSSAMGIATGSAFHQKQNKLKNITVIYCGDAALEEGIFFECANFASLHSLPIIFVCENNLYSVYTNLRERQTMNEFSKYAKAFSISYQKLDGNKIDQVYNYSKKIINYVRKKSRPFFIQMDTYRFKEHCGPNEDDHLNYRNSKELNFWKKKDPLNYSKFLLKKNKISEEIIRKSEKKIKEFVNKQFLYAEKDLLPNFNEASKYIYV